LWLHSLKVAQLLRSAACLHTNQSRSYLNHLVLLCLNSDDWAVLVVSVMEFKVEDEAVPCTGLDKPLRHRGVQAFIIYRQSTHKDGKFVSSIHRSPLPAKR